MGRPKLAIAKTPSAPAPENSAEYWRARYDRLLAQASNALMKMLEERDPYTYGHSMRVMEYTLLIGRGAGMGGGDLRLLEQAAMFHDLGKVGTPDCVLLKPDSLTYEEEHVMQLHSRAGSEILKTIDEFRVLSKTVRHHHERVDGQGYPDGLSGKAIPEHSRMILVADTFDAMTSTRPYRRALPIRVAYEELERCSGTQFEPEFVRLFIREHQALYQAAPPRRVRKAA